MLKVETRALRQLLDENPVVGYAIQRRVSEIFFKRYVETMGRLQDVAHAVAVPRS